MKLKFKLYKKFASLPKDLVTHMLNMFGLDISNWLNAEYHLFIIFDKDIWIGYGLMRCHSFLLANCYLGPTFVKVDYRGQGLQLQLIKKRLRLAKKLGFTSAISSTFSYNFPSNNNLIKAGFLTRKPWAEQELDTVYWEKLL